MITSAEAHEFQQSAWFEDLETEGSLGIVQVATVKGVWAQVTELNHGTAAFARNKERLVAARQHGGQ